VSRAPSSGRLLAGRPVCDQIHRAKGLLLCELHLLPKTPFAWLEAQLPQLAPATIGQLDIGVTFQPNLPVPLIGLAEGLHGYGAELAIGIKVDAHWLPHRQVGLHLAQQADLPLSTRATKR